MIEKGQVRTLQEKLDELEKTAKLFSLVMRLLLAFLKLQEREDVRRLKKGGD